MGSILERRPPPPMGKARSNVVIETITLDFNILTGNIRLQMTRWGPKVYQDNFQFHVTFQMSIALNLNACDNEMLG